ncbi:MAG: YebC/PmpR family DNA-binding transcriptional regulator [Mycoplasmataceae bacterium]|nr:YebC/PmpR family DNA-binding transcriptional regulator [Mycoplasmataceae bacterium]
MAGHSKWKNIQHRKGAQDKKRAKAFQIASKEIQIAMQQGGTDPSNNAALRTAIDKAKASNVPKDNIQRLLDKGNKDKTSYQEIIYEAYAPGGIALIIECLTDNINRTVSKVKAQLTKKGGTLATSGSVLYLFERKGQIIFESDKTEDELMELAINNDATNFESENNMFIVETEPKKWLDMVKALNEFGINEFLKNEISRVPLSEVEIDDEKRAKLEILIESLEDIDDVSSVFSNAA